ncbi:hypothetical protein P7D22_20295 [Lichenihabitans sp. Uapishka_5]|uniref:hypothetical protein n=1 Tax=Lichenihabitans sp. Uapishka_5 TaxID=3037302 RepID=UPI0029E81704|nr:hypothetical protein [Lichenihabitans sp. Uapishka_5]MDX7953509.1 hypothetical protein [Lichenihabitans sp. Uapishka_5]
MDAPLPAELAFIPPGHVPPEALRQAAHRAATLRLPPERLLMAEGLMSSDRYYRCLAAHLGLDFAERPLRPAAAATLDAVLRHGLLLLAPNRHGWHALAAPTGALLRHLLRDAGQGSGVLALTTPERLEALIRQHRRSIVAHWASHGLADWNGALSARSGLTVVQAGVLATLAIGLCGLAVLMPALCLTVLALAFSGCFLLAVAVRLAAATAPAHPVATGAVTDDAALPIYSVVVPLFREAAEVVRLTVALDRLDYPVLGSKHT